MSIHLQVSNCKVWSNSCMSAPQTFVLGKFNLSLLMATWFIVVLLIHNWYDWQQITVCIIQICKFMQKFTKDVVRYTNGFCLPCFQCSRNVQGIFIDDWSQDCRIYKKNLSSGFLKNRKFVGMDQITSKNCNRSSWMQVNKIFLARDRPEQFRSFFACSFQWNQTTMGWSLVSKAYHFLKILANCVDSMLFHCFYDC